MEIMASVEIIFLYNGEQYKFDGNSYYINYFEYGYVEVKLNQDIINLFHKNLKLKGILDEKIGYHL